MTAGGSASLVGQPGRILSFLWALAFLPFNAMAEWNSTSGVLESVGVYGWVHSHPGQILQVPFSKQEELKGGISTSDSFQEFVCFFFPPDLQ